MESVLQYIRETEVFDLEALENIVGIQKGKLRLAVAEVISLSEVELARLDKFLRAIGLDTANLH